MKDEGIEEETNGPKEEVSKMPCMFVWSLSHEIKVSELLSSLHFFLKNLFWTYNVIHIYI